MKRNKRGTGEAAKRCSVTDIAKPRALPDSSILRFTVSPDNVLTTSPTSVKATIMFNSSEELQ